MIERLFPQRIDNTYRGHPLALWLLAPILAVKTGIALGAIFNGRAAAQSADGIPLDSYGAGGAAAVLALFAIWGLAQLVFSVFGVLALIRYRGMISMMFLLLLLEHLARRILLLVKPIARTGTPPGLYINLALLAMMIVGLALSLRSRPESPLPPKGSASPPGKGIPPPPNPLPKGTEFPSFPDSRPRLTRPAEHRSSIRRT